MEQSRNTKFSGELPPEIAALVREFALPRLRYPGKYKEALQERGRADWPALKKKLSSPEAFTVLKFLQAYLAAKREADQAWDIFNDGGNSVSSVNDSRRRRLHAYKELLAHL
jgi:hypothetical protein